MRITTILLLAGAFFINKQKVNAQSAGEKKMILVEQFSNTRCGACANRIPQLRQNMEAFQEDIILISFFTAAPYSSCVLYQANREDSDERSAFYNILGSPSAYVNGERVNIGASIVPPEVFEEEQGQEADLVVSVEPFDTTEPVVVNYEITGTIADEDLRLYVYIIEKYVEAGSISSYRDHYNVMRKNLTPDGGIVINQEPGMQTWTIDEYDIDESWNRDSLEIVAFVQSHESKIVFNAGISGDASPTSVEDIQPELAFDISPNPVIDRLFVNISEEVCQECIITISNMSGQILSREKVMTNHQQGIDVSHLSQGAYTLTLNSNNRVSSKIFIVQK